jgi:hypothetical protein
MRGCLFTLLLGVVVVAVIVVVGLPSVAAGLLTSAVTAAGLQADDTTVTVEADPPTDLLGFGADRVRVRATDATYRGLRIGALDLELHDVAILARTAQAVDGRLTDVVVENLGGREVALDEITVNGGVDGIEATTTIAGSVVERLIAWEAETQLGTKPKSVALVAPDRVIVDVGFDIEGTLDVNANGDLVVAVPDSALPDHALVVLRDGEDLPVRLTGVRVTKAGDLRLTGDVAVSMLGQ